MNTESKNHPAYIFCSPYDNLCPGPAVMHKAKTSFPPDARYRDMEYVVLRNYSHAGR